MHLINLFEDSGLKLYRGDSEHYTKFDTSHSWGSLYGKLIYLTSDQTIAMDYGNWITTITLDRTYISKTINTEVPMNEHLLGVINEYLGDRHCDLRYWVNGSDQRARNFADWVEGFKTRGSRYAWMGHDIGGKGLAPTLDELLVGSHFGYYLRDGGIDGLPPLYEVLASAGYTGLNYVGGVNQSGGEAKRGGGNHRHFVYAMFDFDYCNKHITSQDQI